MQAQLFYFNGQKCSDAWHFVIMSVTELNVGVFGYLAGKKKKGSLSM